MSKTTTSELMATTKAITGRSSLERRDVKINLSRPATGSVSIHDMGHIKYEAVARRNGNGTTSWYLTGNYVA